MLPCIFDFVKLDFFKTSLVGFRITDFVLALYQHLYWCTYIVRTSLRRIWCLSLNSVIVTVWSIGHTKMSFKEFLDGTFVLTQAYCPVSCISTWSWICVCPCVYVMFRSYWWIGNEGPSMSEYTLNELLIMPFSTRTIMLRYLELYNWEYKNYAVYSTRNHSHHWFRHHYRCHSTRKKWAISVSIDIECMLSWINLMYPRSWWGLSVSPPTCISLFRRQHINMNTLTKSASETTIFRYGPWDMRCIFFGVYSDHALYMLCKIQHNVF